MTKRKRLAIAVAAVVAFVAWFVVPSLIWGADGAVLAALVLMLGFALVVLE